MLRRWPRAGFRHEKREYSGHMESMRKLASRIFSGKGDKYQHKVRLDAKIAVVYGVIHLAFVYFVTVPYFEIEGMINRESVPAGIGLPFLIPLVLASYVLRGIPHRIWEVRYKKGRFAFAQSSRSTEDGYDEDDQDSPLTSIYRDSNEPRYATNGELRKLCVYSLAYILVFTASGILVFFLSGTIRGSWISLIANLIVLAGPLVYGALWYRWVKRENIL